MFVEIARHSVRGGGHFTPRIHLQVNTHRRVGWPPPFHYRTRNCKRKGCVFTRAASEPARFPRLHLVGYVALPPASGAVTETAVRRHQTLQTVRYPLPPGCWPTLRRALHCVRYRCDSRQGISKGMAQREVARPPKTLPSRARLFTPHQFVAPFECGSHVCFDYALHTVPCNRYLLISYAIVVRTWLKSPTRLYSERAEDVVLTKQSGVYCRFAESPRHPIGQNP